MGVRASEPPLAKLAPPRLPAVLERGRLFRQFDTCRKRPIVWLSAPPGAGKTTLLASYLRARHLRCLWYQFDDRDDDPGSFFHYLSLAGKTLKRGSAKPLPRLLPEHWASLSAFSRHFFEALYRRAKPPFVLVFDNYQELATDAPLHELLSAGFGAIPDGINVVVSSRELPPAPFSSFQANRTMSRIPPEAFRLTLSEARAIARLQAPALMRRRQRELSEVHRKLRGWAAGLVLYLEHSSYEGGEISSAMHDTLQTTFNYLSREVLRKLSPEAQGFLSTTAFLPHMTPDLARILTSYDSAGEFLDWLYRNRFFVERRGSPDRIYQYHPLFRSSLLKQARQQMDPSSLEQVQLRAAHCLEEVGRFEDAFALFRDVSRIEEEIRIILAQAPVLMSEGRSRTLEEWIDEVPPARLTDEPWLLYWLASCRLLASPEESEALFARAFEQFSAHGDQQGTLLAWCGVVQSIMFAWRDLSRIRLWLDRFPDVISGRYPAMPEEIEARLVFTVFSGLMWSRPEDPSLHKWTERALDQVRTVKDLALAASLGQGLTLYSAWTGNPALGERVTATVGRRLEHGDIPVLAMVNALMSKGIHAWAIGEPELSLQSLQAGLDLVKRHGITVFESPLRSMLVYPLIYLADWRNAKDALEGLAPELEDKKDLMGATFHYQSGWVAMAQEEPELALGHVTKVLTTFSGAVGPFAQAHLQRGAGEALSDLGQHSEAINHFAQVEDFAVRARSQSLLFACYLSRADIAFHEGDESGGVQYLKHAMELGRAQGYVDASWWKSKKMASLCNKALDEEIEPDYVTALIRKRKLQPPPDASEAWPWPVKVRALGAFEVTVDGSPIRFARKAQRRPMTLLKAIIALGGQRVPLHSLADALWPESDGDRAHQALEVTTHRLRKLLRHAEALVVGEGFASLDERHCWVDVWRLELILHAALNAKDPEELCSLGVQALRVYRGPFLTEDVDEPWTAPLRQKLALRLRRVAARLLSHGGMNLPQHAVPSLQALLSDESIGRGRTASWNGVADMTRH